MANKQNTKAPENIEAVSKTEAFIEKYKKHILYCVCAIVVIAAAAIAYVQFVRNPRNQKASEALAQCEALFLKDAYDKALEGDGQGCIGFLKVADEFSSTKAGNLAKLYAGLCYAQLDSMDVALKYLEKFSGKDQMVAPSALGALGHCYATAGQYNKAISAFEKAAKKADNGLLSPYYYMQAGLIYEAIDKPAQAVKIYKLIKAQYPESNEGIEADKFIARLTSK